MNRYRKFSLLFFLSFLIASQAANSNIDSLKQQFSSQKGESKIVTGLQICEELADDPTQLLIFSQSLLKTAEKIAPNTLLLAKVNKSVADGYFYLDSLTRSNEFLLKAALVAESVEPIDTQFVGGAYNDIGYNYLESENRIEARSYLLRAINYLKGTRFYSELADTESNLAILNYKEGNYQEAISLFLDVYQLDLKTGNKNRQSASLNSLGRMYVDWGKYETGLDYYFRSVALLDTIKEKRTLGIRYNNIGMVFQLTGKHIDAIHWFEKAKRIDESEGPSIRLGIRYFNLGNSYLALKNYTQSEFYLKKSETIFSPLKQYSQTSKVYGSLGQLYLSMDLPDKAVTCLLKSKELAEQSGTLPEKSISYEQLYKYYKSIGNFSEALKFYELHTDAEDSIFNLKVSEQVEEMEAQYQNKQKEAEITRLESENQLKIKELAFKNRQRNWALAVLAFLLIVSVSMYLLFNTVKRQKTELAKQNQELDRLNKTLNRLFAIISHDLRNATAAYQSSAKIIDYHLGKGQPEKLLPLSGEISSNARNLSAMLENLLQWSVSQMKGIELQKQLLIVKEELEKITSLLKNDAERKSNEIVIISNNEETVWCDPESFNLIFRNLLGNSLKFTSKGKILLETTSSKGFTILKICDTGCGIPKNMIDGIFIIGSGKIRAGTSGEKGTGLGLMMVAEHVEKNGGTITVESKEGEGTTFIVSLPSEKI
jgi:signal transduction histidine kinase/tetratricopeptide (TPR) repeat protein